MSVSLSPRTVGEGDVMMYVKVALLLDCLVMSWGGVADDKGPG
jgi:hypothetical protein